MRTIHFPMGDSAANGPVGAPSHGHNVAGHDPAAPPGGPNGGGWPAAPAFMDPLHMDFQFMFNPEAPDHQLFAPPPPPPHDPAAPPADPQAGHPHPHPTPHAQHPPHPHPHPHAHQHQHPPSYAVTQPPSTQSPEGPQPMPNDDDHEDDEQDGENGSTTYYPNKPTKKTPPQVDPYAAGFLREVLGLDKWNTFSSRLFERRLVGPRARQKTKGGGKANGAKDDGRDGQWSASVVDFLTKAEAVKEVLRTYVPHPYNPHKTLSHPYVPAPSGRVTLSRSTVLALSGWSNTQFSYWARRSEAISVLGIHDRRLRNVAIALSHRLRGEPLENEAETVNGITGKGLDAIVEEVKDRTGASQFLRGKHSSLDPFGLNDAMTGDVDHRSLHTSPLVGGGPSDAAAGLPGQPPPPQQQHYVSTFDSHGYGPTTTTTNYFSPAMSDARSMSPEHRDQARPMTATMATAQQLPPGYAIGFPSVAAPHDPNAATPADPSQSPQSSQQPPPPARATNRYPSRAKRASGTAAASANGNAGTNGAAKAIKPDSSRREYFPVSDSRSEVEAGAAAPASGTAATGKRKAAAENGPSKKRSRTTVAGGGDA